MLFLHPSSSQDVPRFLKRLRCWAAAFLASLGLGHFWYLPIVFLHTKEDVELVYFVGGLLDCMFMLPLSILFLFSLLQDRRRSFWPVGAALAPLVAGGAWRVFSRSDELLPVLTVYLLLFGLAFVIYIFIRKSFFLP